MNNDEYADRIHKMMSDYFGQDVNDLEIWMDTKHPFIGKGKLTPKQLISEGSAKDVYAWIHMVLKDRNYVWKKSYKTIVKPMY